MKINAIQLINILLLLCLIDIIKNRYINDISFKEAIKNKKIYDKSELINNNNLNYNPKQTKLFFSENKNKYYELSDISNSSINYQDIIKNSSFYEIPENLISQYEKKYQREKISKIIRTIENNKNNINYYLNQNNYNNHHNKKEHKYYYENNINNNNNNEYFSDEYNFYGNKKLLNFDYNYYWNKLISPNSIINELSTSPIKELISTEPEHIYLEQKIETIKRIEANKQILLFNSNKLQDNKTILECGINKESIIVLIIMEETEKLNEKLKNEIKFLEKALLEEINKNEKMEELLKMREILLNDLNSQIQSLKYEKEKIIKVLENELEKEGEYKKRIEKLERGYKKKKYVEEDFLEVKEFLEKEKEKEIQIYLKNLISIIFISNEQGIYWSVICNKTDFFSKLQQSFFERYPEYNEENNYFVFNGINIEKENTLKDIGIKHNDLIIMKEK